MQNSDVVNKMYYIEKTAICRFAHFEESGERALACCKEETLEIKGGICSVTRSC